MKYTFDKGAHSVYTLNYHLIICVKYRKEIFVKEEIIDQLKVQARQIASSYDIGITSQETDRDHVHILFSATPKTNLVKFINALKGATARKIRKDFPEVKNKLWKDVFWSPSYCLITTGQVTLDQLKKYVESQGEKREMQTIYKFRLYPSAEEEKKLLFVLEICRLLYNSFLTIWNDSEKIPSRYKLQAMLPAMKENHEGLKKVNSKTLQMVLFMLYNNLKALRELKKKGRKVGKLRYKKYGKIKSFILNQSGFKVIKTDKRLGRLYISKVGDIPIRIHREIDGVIKQVIVKQYKTGEWYAMVCVDRKFSAIARTIEKVIGLDMGIKFFLSDSDGRQIENPKFYKKTLERIKVEQRKLSRKKKGSQNRKKEILRLAKLHQRLTSQRDDFLHKLSRFYVDTYDLISVENLNVKGMAKNHHLAQSILDASWSKFFRMLESKAEIAGAIVPKVNPRGTSKEHKYGMEIDRDYNVSINILERGLVGQGLPFMPSEVEPLRTLIQVSASSIVEVGSPFF